MSSRPSVLTIGHSNHAPERLVDLLRQHEVSAVADVRSAPYSRMYSAFNKESLAAMLKEHGIAYVYLGRELGARTEDPSCYLDGKVQYRRLAQTPLFQSGLERVMTGAAERTVSLLCAEKEPLDCHRTILVSRELELLGAEVAHIHADGGQESHADTIQRLLAVFKLDQPDMFRTPDESVELAYARQEARIAYVVGGDGGMEDE